MSDNDVLPNGSPLDKASRKPLTYSSYLEIDALLDLQRPQSDGPNGPEHDEMLFIVIHQVYELWFKQVIHETGGLMRRLDAGEGPVALATFKRILTILKTMVGQVDILETMTPMSFNSFRDRLDSASGFQSAQFRELEFLLGHKRLGIVHHHPEGSPGRTRIESLLDEPTLWDSFLRFLVGRGFDIPKSSLERDIREPIEASAELQAVLLEVYQEDHLASQLCERLVDLDEGIQEWRYRHVKMVERTIGHKVGTGGSAGADYLRKTLFKPLFPDLWDIRSEL